MSLNYEDLRKLKLLLEGVDESTGESFEFSKQIKETLHNAIIALQENTENPIKKMSRNDKNSFINYLENISPQQAKYKALHELTKAFFNRPQIRSNYSKLSNVDKLLYDKLKEMRLDLARQEAVPVYIIFNNETLEEIVKIKPTSSDSLLKIKGIGFIKQKKYSSIIVSTVGEHLDEQFGCSIDW